MASLVGGLRAAGQPPFVTLYRLKTVFDAPPRLRFHVSADERCILYLDETRLGCGSPLY